MPLPQAIMKSLGLALLLGYAALFGGGTLASAQETNTKSPTEVSGATEDYIAGLKACQTISDGPMRLRCYDDAVGRVVSASDEGAVKIVDAEDVQKTRRRLFGFSLPDLNLFGGDGKEEKVDLLESVITKVSILGRSTVIITIEEGGAVWRIPSADSLTLQAKAGDSVVFKEAALGSYFIRINGRNGVKGRRIE